MYALQCLGSKEKEVNGKTRLLSSLLIRMYANTLNITRFYCSFLYPQSSSFSLDHLFNSRDKDNSSYLKLILLRKKLYRKLSRTVLLQDGLWKTPLLHFIIFLYMSCLLGLSLQNSLNTQLSGGASEDQNKWGNGN